MKIIFTEHAKARIIKRKITEQEVMDIINYPEKIDKKHEQYYFSKKLPYGTIEICCEKTETHKGNNNLLDITKWK